MEKNNIKLTISGVVQMVILNDLVKVPKFPRSGTCFFSRKSEMAARSHSKIVTYKEFNINSFVISLFHFIFYGELISGLIFKFESLIRVLFAKIQNGRLMQY